MKVLFLISGLLKAQFPVSESRGEYLTGGGSEFLGEILGEYLGEYLGEHLGEFLVKCSGDF